jgi:hypothetical protein
MHPLNSTLVALSVAAALVAGSGAALAQAAPAPAAPSAVTPSEPPAMSDPKQLTGLAAWEKVVGNSISGMVEGRAFAEYYSKDGTVKFRIDGKTSTGRWLVDGDGICFEYPGDPRECFRLTLSDGKEVIWTDGKGVIDTRGTLAEGNAENL